MLNEEIVDLKLKKGYSTAEMEVDLSSFLKTSKIFETTATAEFHQKYGKFLS